MLLLEPQGQHDLLRLAVEGLLRLSSRSSFTSCWVIVEPPCETPPASTLAWKRPEDAADVDAVVDVEARVLDRQDGVDHVLGDCLSATGWRFSSPVSVARGCRRRRRCRSAAPVGRARAGCRRACPSRRRTSSRRARPARRRPRRRSPAMARMTTVNLRRDAKRAHAGLRERRSGPVAEPVTGRAYGIGTAGGRLARRRSRHVALRRVTADGTRPPLPVRRSS